MGSRCTARPSCILPNEACEVDGSRMRFCAMYRRLIDIRRCALTCLSTITSIKSFRPPKSHCAWKKREMMNLRNGWGGWPSTWGAARARELTSMKVPLHTTTVTECSSTSALKFEFISFTVQGNRGVCSHPADCSRQFFPPWLYRMGSDILSILSDFASSQIPRIHRKSGGQTGLPHLARLPDYILHTIDVYRKYN